MYSLSDWTPSGTIYGREKERICFSDEKRELYSITITIIIIIEFNSKKSGSNLFNPNSQTNVYKELLRVCACLLLGVSCDHIPNPLLWVEYNLNWARSMCAHTDEWAALCEAPGIKSYAYSCCCQYSHVHVGLSYVGGIIHRNPIDKKTRELWLGGWFGDALKGCFSAPSHGTELANI